MKVELSVDQFRSLMELVYLGDWMVNGIRSPDSRVERYQDLLQYLASLAGKFGLQGVVEFDEQLREFTSTREFEEAMEAYIREYDDEVFWDGLVDRLADRDLLAEYGEALKAMPVEQVLSKREPLVERYEREVEEHGVERLRIIEF
jgi:hypothetical protein